MVKNCPNCGVDAIYYDKTTKPKQTVWCNNCGAEYIFRNLKRRAKIG